MKNKLVGLDIGSTAIKVAGVKKAGEGFAIESIAQIVTPPKGMMSDASSDLQVVADSVKKLFSSANIKVHDVALSLPDSEVFTKVIDMPQLSEAELSAALKFEIEQYIPLPVEKVKTDWQILGKNTEEGKNTMSVMLVAAPIVLLEKYQKVMDLAGLNCEIVETEIISVHRSLFPLLSDTFPTMIVHMGAVSTTIAIVKGGIIKTVFSINQGGLAFTKAISIELGIDMNQAENYKRTYGFSTTAFEGKIGKILQVPCDVIIGDIKKAALSFREKNNNENIKQIILSGGSSLLPGLDVILTNALSIQVVFGNAFAANNIQNAPAELVSESPSYNVVVGLGLRSIL